MIEATNGGSFLSAAPRILVTVSICTHSKPMVSMIETATSKTVQTVNMSHHELRNSSIAPFLVFNLVITPFLYLTLLSRTSSLAYKLARSL